MKKPNTRLAIFDTFKTKNDLTGEANRQRMIISILSGNGNSTEKTRTGISKFIAREHNIVWKNIYSGVFRDLDEILIPMGMVKEHGRLPLRRGPKALQEKGIPYYHLTKKGILLALATCQMEEQRHLLERFFAESEPVEKKFEKIISSLQETSPNFIYSLFEKYVKAFCEGKFGELLPFDLSKLGGIPDETLVIQKEMLSAVLVLSKESREKMALLLDEITNGDAKH